MKKVSHPPPLPNVPGRHAHSLLLLFHIRTYKKTIEYEDEDEDEYYDDEYDEYGEGEAGDVTVYGGRIYISPFFSHVHSFFMTVSSANPILQRKTLSKWSLSSLIDCLGHFPMIK